MADLTDIAAQCPEIRRANKAEAAQFFDITLPTLEKWLREGAPVLQRGARGVSWVLDLRAMAQWRYETRLPEGGLDPETLTPAERKLWYDGETRRRDLQVRDRELIPASEVESAVAQAFASLAQAVQSLPDELEQDAALTPEQAEAAERSLHRKLNAVADQLSALAPVEAA
jgi:terminase small subunit / prophage DNA-packing protein